MNPSNYKRIENTPLGVSFLQAPVSYILFSGKDVNVTVDTTAGNVIVELSPYSWEQAVISTLVINNSAGANNINLVSSTNSDPFVVARVLQVALKLTTVGASTILRLVRAGTGTATISVNGVQVMTNNTLVAYVLVQATAVTPEDETNIIVPVLGDTGGSAYVTLATNQTISGIKTFTASPVISTITNTGTLTLPTTTGTLALTSQTVDLTTNQVVGGSKTFTEQSYFSDTVNITSSTNQIKLGTGITTTLSATPLVSNKTLTLPDVTGTLLANVTGVTLNTNQTIGGNKTFSSKVAITPTSNQIDLGTGPNITTISSIAPTASRTYTIRDAETDADFILSNSGLGQTIAGGLTSSGITTLGSSLQRSVHSISTNTILSTTQNGHYVVVTANSITITLPSIATNSLLTGYEYYILNIGTGFVTIIVNNISNEVFNNNNTFVNTLYLNQNDRVHVISYSNGTIGIWTVESNFTLNPVESSVIPRETNRNWPGIASSSDGMRLVAVVNGGQIYTSTNGGVNWTARETNRNWFFVASSNDGMRLAAIVTGGQIYISTDGGVNWNARETNRNWTGIASSSDGMRLVAVVNGGQIYTSTDGGDSWDDQESNRQWRGVASSSDGLRLAAIVSGVSPGQIYTSTNGGVNWTARETNRNWRGIASSSDGLRLVATVSSGQIYTSTDGGVNWTARETNRNWRGVASSSDGLRLVALVNGGRIYTSIDGGVNWTQVNLNPINTDLNWTAVTSNSDGSKIVATVTIGQIYSINFPVASITSLSRNLQVINGSNTPNLNVVGIPVSTLSANNAMTTTNASSLYIEGAPLLSTNITRTNAYALNVASGNSIFGGNVRFTGQSMFTGSIHANNSTNFPITRSYKTSRTSTNANPAVISYGMQWPLGGDTFGADSAGTYLISLSLQSGDFGLPRAVWLGYAEMSGFAGAKCQVFTILQSNIASVVNDTFGNITITFSAGVTPNTIYEITQTQIGY